MKVEDIQEVFTVEQLQLWMNDSIGQSVVFGIINAYLTNFNVDSPNQHGHDNISVSRW